ncbi:DUF5681 domain-containing protein [Altericroceibacterium xinjiangense]|uniref:DUF5681 domain-containing protein n=1 Tax=Altericroceibacterium xinjiangense TaxID=762261 RepID=UPI000F7F0CC3|nr:DUF5681 domain-containing protein [Altericroceibacterium xinjiangense]
MARKRRGPWKRQEPSSLDVGLDPLFSFGEGKSARRVSGAELLWRQQFKRALEGDPKAFAEMLKIVRINEREREKQQGRGPLLGKERRPRRLVNAEEALQILGIAWRCRGGTVERVGLAPWAFERAGERLSKHAARKVDWSSPYAQPLGGPRSPLYPLHDQPEVEPKPKRSAEETRFQKGESGNPKGRPPKEKLELPFEGFLNEKGTLRVNGVDCKLTRLEALIHQMNLRAIKGDDKLAAILNRAYTAEHYARWLRSEHVDVEIVRGEQVSIASDPFGDFLQKLGVANGRTVKKLLVEPWIVLEALERLGRELTVKEQEVVFRSTSKAKTVCWPEWWTVRR